MFQNDNKGSKNLVLVNIMTAFNDRVSYIVLRGCWCNIIVLNVYAPNEDKSDDSNDSFYEELEQVLDHFSKYSVKIGERNYFQIDNWE